jgi:CBS-domain-containing membrane protein
MNVASIMSTPVIGIAPTATIAEAIRLMLNKRVSGLPVVTADGTLTGMLSEGDLLRRKELGTVKNRSRWIEFLLGEEKLADEYIHTHGRHVSDVMSGHVISVGSTASLEDAVSLMLSHGVKRLPVLENGKLIGIVSRADILHALVCQLPADGAQISDARICADIFAELKGENWINSDAIQVKVTDGAVVLSGAIFHERTRQALVVAAENVPGVKSVTEHLLLIESFSATPIHPAA